MSSETELRETGTGVLMTPDGCSVLNGSPEFLALLGDAAPDYDAVLFAVKNLGFVHWRRCGPLLEIIVHPRAVGPAAVEAMILLISASAAGHFTIRYLSDFEWREECPASAL